MEPIERIIPALEDGKNLLITGGAGVGKSYNLRKVIEWADDQNLNVARTALTGMASLQFDFGETLHRCMGIGFAKNKSDLSTLTQSFKFVKTTRWEIQAIDILIIDEVSMLRSDLLELIDELLKYVHGNDKTFGGIQVIFSGDFMQLPPIVKPEEKKELPRPWSFQSDVFRDLNFEIIYLKEIKRQDDNKFCMALNMLRAGVVNDAVDEYFFNTYKHKFPDGIEPVNLLSTNVEVNRVNEKRLNKIDAELETYKAKIFGDTQKLKDQIKRDSPAMEMLELKIGAQVMILVNSPDYQFVNGSMGEYLGMCKASVGSGLFEEEKDAVIVKLFDSGERAIIPIYEWRVEKKVNDKIKVLARLEQFPVKLGWAITVHKSQGMTLDYLQVDLVRCFAEGMAYVALSRAKTYEGLKVINWRRGAVRCNKDAFEFYMNLKNRGEI